MTVRIGKPRGMEVDVLSGWNLELGRVQHGHGHDDWHDMTEVMPDSAENDPERDWSRGRIFRCTTCEDEIRVVRSDEPPSGR